MSKTFSPYEPDQQLLPPTALQEWLPPDHLAYFISDVVDNWTSPPSPLGTRARRGVTLPTTIPG